MKKEGCFAISFDTCRVVIRCEGLNALDLLYFLFKENLQSTNEGAYSQFTVTSTGPHIYLLYQGEKLLCEGAQGKVAVRLLDSVIYELAKETRGGLLFHAAALSRNGCSVLAPGRSGSGKTFFAANLSDNGYSYLTDEMTLMKTGNFRLSGFYKPLYIKNASAFKDQITKDASYEIPTLSGSVDLPVSNGFLTNCFHENLEKRLQGTKAAMVIFPRYKEGSQLEVKRLPCAKTGLLLMQCLINARNLVSHGFHEICAFSRSVPAYILTYGDLSGVPQTVDALLDA